MTQSSVVMERQDAARVRRLRAPPHDLRCGRVEAGGRRGTHSASRHSPADAERRRRLLRHGLPALAVLGLLAIAVGLLIGGGGGRAERDVAARFAALWAEGDYGRMYDLLDEPARARTPFQDFAAAYRAAAQTATIRTIEVGDVGDRSGDRIPVALTIRTRAFGAVRGTLELPVSGSGEALRIAWRAEAAFPGLRPGEQLTRATALPPRAALLARDGTVLAAGDDRRSEDPEVSAHIAGRLGPAPPEQASLLRSLGHPPGALVGVSGLERAFQRELAGTPGGTLLAGGRVVARRAPRAATAIRTTIDREVERAAIGALAGRYGGIAALDPATGEILALAGVAFSALQPPGSTFKVVTLTGALEAGIAKPDTSFPIQSETTIEGVAIENANGEYCGGTLVASFAHSCNSVFAPLGARLGAARLVDVAERFGFNEAQTIPGAAASTIPAAQAIGDDLAVGSSAIGQGLVQATALQMATVAATIATEGRRPLPTLRLGGRPRFVRVTRPRIARQVARMMRAAVAYGTGTAAAIAGADVAGKTGTAELRSTVPADEDEEDAEDEADRLEEDLTDTDAWFIAFAPSKRPRIAVGALFVEAGAGGDVAAPAAREVLLAGLRRRDRG
jgi:peptidoglycan glycosyltransferase